MGARRMGGWVVTVGCLAGCASGPMAIEVALRRFDVTAFRDAIQTDLASGKTAYLRMRAEEEGVGLAAMRVRDDGLRRNPFEADDDRALAVGGLIYSVHCSDCHGLDADGQGWQGLRDHPPQNFRSFWVRVGIALNGSPSKEWFERTRDGNGPMVKYPEGRSQAMPAFGNQLANEQIWMALVYLASAGHE